MKKNKKSNYKSIQLIFGLSFILLTTSCSVTKYYNHETPSGTYAELILKGNDTFEEYVYLDAGDSLGKYDYGTLLKGSYENNGDTLVLCYVQEEISAPNLPTSEVYIWQNGNLIKLAPITYSHHFLNMIFSPGKSERLRAIPNYDLIIWKTNN